VQVPSSDQWVWMVGGDAPRLQQSAHGSSHVILWLAWQWCATQAFSLLGLAQFALLMRCSWMHTCLPGSYDIPAVA